MPNGSAIPWESLERRRATAFVAASVLLFPFFVSNGLNAFAGGGAPRWVDGLFIMLGVIASHVGLLGLVPQMADRAPKRAYGGAVIVVIAIVSVIGMFVADLLISASSVTVPVFVSGIFWLVAVLTTILGFVLLGTAVLRTGVPATGVGVALLAPPIIYGTMLVTFFATGMAPPEWTAVVLSGGQVVAHFVIGWTLVNSAGGTDSPAPASEPTTR